MIVIVVLLVVGVLVRFLFIARFVFCSCTCCWLGNGNECVFFLAVGRKMANLASLPHFALKSNNDDGQMLALAMAPGRADR